jgi:threonine synthase
MDHSGLVGKLPHVTGLQCVVCGATYSLDEATYTCPACGPVGTLDVLYQHNAHQYTAAERPVSFWQQRDLLPIASEPPVALRDLGNTPLIAPPALHHVAESIGVAELWIKNDGLNLTGSFKDRASAMVVAHAVQNIGVRTIATASTGNAAAALAGMCAAVPDAHAIIFVPASAPPAKIAQILVYGAQVILIDGTYDQAFDLCGWACETFGWYNRNTGINPITTEGKKTAAFEIAAQMEWDVPDVVIVSVGDGSIIGGVYKGFREMFEREWIPQMPRLIGVQSSGSDALVDAWERDLTPQAMLPRPANTVADSISSGLPRDRAKALRAVRESQGAMVHVDDAAILKAIPRLARTTGIFAEPAAAAAYAGLKPALESGYIAPTDRVLLLVTGNGMKDIAAATQAVQAETPRPTPPTIEAVRDDIARWKST